MSWSHFGKKVTTKISFPKSVTVWDIWTFQSSFILSWMHWTFECKCSHRVCIAVSISISPFLSKPSKHVLPESPKQPLSTFNMTTSSLEGYQVIHPLGFVTLSVLLKKLHFWSLIHHDYAILVPSFNCAIPRYHSVAILISIFQLRDFDFQVLRLCNYSLLNIPIVTIMMRNWNLVDQNCTW